MRQCFNESRKKKKPVAVKEKKSNLRGRSKVERKMWVRAGIMQECEPAVKFNESREAEQERAKESAVPSTDMRIQFMSFKYESKHREKRNFAKDRKKIQIRFKYL